MTVSFGADWQRDFWQSPYALRFDLGAGGENINMFSTAYDRARTLARAALTGRDVVAIVAAYPDSNAELAAERKGWTQGSAFELLAAMGAPTDRAIAEWPGYWWPGAESDPDETPWVHRALRLTWPQADVLLWNQLAHDLGVTPQAPVQSKLVDLERGVCVNAYDDRGMDIIGLSKPAVSHLFVEFSDWLNAHSRPGINEAFQD
ncbi:MAG TPA: DUF3885 domain-containing protein [Caulobacteraceae bacterium]|nr:DUF3885 domain-containing protein [Caulobacteraceae bacterium]